MSIAAIMGMRVTDGTLLPYHAPGPGPDRRFLLLSARLAQEISDPRSAIGYFGQKRHVVELFDLWVLGRGIHVRMRGRSSAASLALLRPPPPEIWEMRITTPQPQIRVFGRFAAPDMFIALLARNRDRLGAAREARGSRGAGWQEAMYGCEAEWNRIFGGEEPFRGQCASGYVTSNAIECP